MAIFERPVREIVLDMKKSKGAFWLGFVLILIWDYIRFGFTDVLLTEGTILCLYGIVTAVIKDLYG